MSRAVLTASESDYLVRLLTREREKWSERHDDAVSHDAIVRRDRAASAVASIDTILAKLSGSSLSGDPGTSESQRVGPEL